MKNNKQSERGRKNATHLYLGYHIKPYTFFFLFFFVVRKNLSRFFFVSSLVSTHKRRRTMNTSGGGTGGTTREHQHQHTTRNQQAVVGSGGDNVGGVVPTKFCSKQSKTSTVTITGALIVSSVRFLISPNAES